MRTEENETHSGRSDGRKAIHGTRGLARGSYSWINMTGAFTKPLGGQRAEHLPPDAIYNLFLHPPVAMQRTVCQRAVNPDRSSNMFRGERCGIQRGIYFFAI